MRILNADNDIAIKDIILYLRAEEAKQLYHSIDILLQRNDLAEHIYIDAEYTHEITVLLYDEKQVKSLDEHSKKIIAGYIVNRA